MAWSIANLTVALVALIVSLAALGLSIHFWRREFRPIVSAAVRTHSGGHLATTYDLMIQNSGAIPAKNIRLRADESALAAAFAQGANEPDKEHWLECFRIDPAISLLQNGDRTSCSFGTTRPHDAGFWKQGATIPIVIAYEGWFGRKYVERQNIKIADSNSFTGHYWAEPRYKHVVGQKVD